jgi:hypothetical protein
LNLIILDWISGWVLLVFGTASAVVKTRAALQIENIALRHQIGVLQRSAKKRVLVNSSDRLLWVWLSRVWPDWRSALVIVKPETVIACIGKAFGCSGLGKSGTESLDGQLSRRRFATSFARSVMRTRFGAPRAFTASY